MPSCPVQSSRVASGTSACLRPQLWVAVKHEACLELEINRSLKYYSLQAVNTYLAFKINVWAPWNSGFCYSELFCHLKWTFGLNFFFSPALISSMFCISVWGGNPRSLHAFICVLCLNPIVYFLPEPVQENIGLSVTFRLLLCVLGVEHSVCDLEVEEDILGTSSRWIRVPSWSVAKV